MNEILRLAMVEKGFTTDSLAAAVGVDPKTAVRWVSLIHRIPHPKTRVAVAAALGREVGELWPEVMRPKQISWFRPWSDVEELATSLRAFQANVIPGLLQTEDYARAVLMSGPLVNEDIESLVAARIERQAAVFERARPPMCVFVVDEAALQRGEPEVMHPSSTIWRPWPPGQTCCFTYCPSGRGSTLDRPDRSSSRASRAWTTGVTWTTRRPDG